MVANIANAVIYQFGLHCVYWSVQISIFNGYLDSSAVDVLCWIFKGEGGKVCGNMCLCERERTVSCGACGDGEKGGIRLEWFVKKANWDGDGSGKVCSCGWELCTTVSVKRNEMSIHVRGVNKHGGE